MGRTSNEAHGDTVETACCNMLRLWLLEPYYCTIATKLFGGWYIPY